MNSPYTPKFFSNNEALSRQSAALVIPLVLEMVPAASVVDVGCGIGTWLTEFKEAGVKDYVGVDGDYVSRAQLLIESERFLPHDLSRPFELGRRFDLASCLEVAEHLPSESAPALVDSLVRLAPVVLFSAAIPNQQGNHHVNEQWPEYWHIHFAQRNYVAIDALRRPLWRNASVARWYRQNLLFFVERNSLPNYPRLQAVFEADGESPPLALVHPEHYLELYRAMHDVVLQTQRFAMRASMKLRDMNLVVFPDWNQPAEVLTQQMRTLYQALASHPQQTRIALVVHLGTQPQVTSAYLEQASREVPFPPGTTPDQMPAVRGAGGTFRPDEWEVLLECCQARITLPDESTGTIATLGADRLQPLPLEALVQRQLLSVEGVAK